MDSQRPLEFDHVLVGAGQATGTLVAGLPDDASIAVIEMGDVGGTCVNTGCTPTKTLLASARVAHMARRAGDYGVTTGDVGIDFARVRDRMNEVRHASRDGLTRLLESTDNVTLIRGRARFEGPRRLRVGADTVVAGDRIYLDVGARAREPSIPGLGDVPWLNEARLLELTEPPDHLIVVGGGYLGLEFAQMFRRFGSEVTVIARGDRLLSREDADVGEGVRRILEGEGIDVRLGAEVVRAARVRDAGGRDGVEVMARGASGERAVRGSHLLLAVGRVPNTDGLGLDAAGVETDERGHVRVDDRLRTTAEGTFALGDVNGQGAFTHTAVNDAEIVLDVLGEGDRRLSDRIPVYAMFTDPPLGRVGLSEREALHEGRRVLKATRPMASISRAKEMGETEGFVKLLVDADDDRILGAAVLGVNGDEVVNMFAAFMYSGLPCHHFRKAVLVHPTVSELMPFILDELKPVSPGEDPDLGEETGP